MCSKFFELMSKIVLYAWISPISLTPIRTYKSERRISVFLVLGKYYLVIYHIARLSRYRINNANARSAHSSNEP